MDISSSGTTTNAQNTIFLGSIGTDGALGMNERTQLPPTVDVNHGKEVHIIPLGYGYLVKIGCQEIAIESPEKLVKHLLAYLKKPAAVEMAFLAGKYKI